jgi:hypothetical protein
MPAYTAAELHRLHDMRKQEKADWERRNSFWDAAGQGHTSTETEYQIQYQHRNDTIWYAASPFYEPLSLTPDQTYDRDRAAEIAELILAGKWGVTKQSAPDNDITAVRVIEVVSTTTILVQRHTETP